MEMCVLLTALPLSTIRAQPVHWCCFSRDVLGLSILLHRSQMFLGLMRLVNIVLVYCTLRVYCIAKFDKENWVLKEHNIECLLARDKVHHYKEHF